MRQRASKCGEAACREGCEEAGGRRTGELRPSLGSYGRLAAAPLASAGLGPRDPHLLMRGVLYPGHRDGPAHHYAHGHLPGHEGPTPTPHLQAPPGEHSKHSGQHVIGLSHSAASKRCELSCCIPFFLPLSSPRAHQHRHIADPPHKAAPLRPRHLQRRTAERRQ